MKDEAAIFLKTYAMIRNRIIAEVAVKLADKVSQYELAKRFDIDGGNLSRLIKKYYGETQL